MGGEQVEVWPSLAFVFDQTEKQFRNQWELWDSLDRRLQLILGFIGVIFAAILGLLRPAQNLWIWVAGFAVTAMALFLVAAALVGWAYWPRTFEWPPNPPALRDNYLASDERATRLVVLDTMLAAYDHNVDTIALKALAFKRAFIISAVAVTLLGVAVMIQVFVQAGV